MSARTLVPFFVAVALAGAACPRGPAGGGAASDTTADTTGAAAGDTVRDAADSSAGGGAASQAGIERLEREARALAKVEGCNQAAQCRTAPVGSRPCGGPRDYVVYCALTTDSVALFRKLGELEAAEKAYNERAGLVSTCEFRMPPAVALAGGRCTAGGAP